MGQTTDVAYSFGQLGSAFTNLAKPIYPPQDHVIVAVQFLADNTPTEMLTETLDSAGPQFPGTDDTEASAANFGGVYFDACTGAITAASDLIKVGQYVLLINDADTIDAGMTVDAETVTPVYNGPGRQGVRVTKVNGVNITLDKVLTPANTQTLVFLDASHGAGGSTMVSVVFPKGVTIYGRWTKIIPSAAPVICYFGK